MNRKEIESLLNETVQLSKIDYCDGGLRFELILLPCGSNLNQESKKAHKEFGDRTYTLKNITEVSEKEFKKTLEEFFSNLLKKKGNKYSQNLINLLNINLAPFTPYTWEADFSGYGYALILAIESEQGNLLLLMDWTID